MPSRSRLPPKAGRFPKTDYAAAMRSRLYLRRLQREAHGPRDSSQGCCLLHSIPWRARAGNEPALEGTPSLSGAARAADYAGHSPSRA
jgi:hypothetical protein